MKSAHYSIDDVWKSLRYLERNRPDSLFDMRFFSTLKNFHERFHAKFSLYCIMRMPFEGYLFLDMPEVYRNEFKNCADWLRFGFHSVTDKPFSETDFYQEEFIAFGEKAESLGMGKTDILRLHSWSIRDDQLDFLKNQGVAVVLSPDEAGLTYNENGFFTRRDMLFKRTDIWLEKTEDIDEKQLKLWQKNCTLFTHEWCFDEQKDKMETALSLHFQNGYQFL